MPTILVADDNSNIQKMVTLALKDLGIDVVAVGNGEAAVRQLPDTMPDMVLADIFMPVRNGYEVCEFIKQDGRYGHIPVVLLVGTFDPLDEKEVARVGADGVLKKPFVPPDALVTTVKGTLEKLGVLGTKEQARERRRIPAPAPAVPPPPPETQPEPEEYEERRAPVAFQGEEAPPAFSEFLESSSSTEEVAEVNEEVAHPAKPPASDWHRLASEAAPEAPTFGPLEHELVREPEKQEEEPQRKRFVPPSPWEPGGRWQGEKSPPSKEENVEAAPPTPSRTFVSPWAYPAGEEVEDEAPAPAGPESQQAPPATEVTAPSKLEGAEAAIAEAAARVISFPEVAAEIFSGAAHEFSPGNQGETEATADLAPAAASPAGPTNPPTPEASGAETPPSTVPTAKLDPAAVDAAVERVMSQLQPQIVDMISRNVVRPIVTAILQREIEKRDK